MSKKARKVDIPESGLPCPIILPSRTTHTRFFPKRHSFSYSYLQVSIPVEFEGSCGSLISVGESSKKGWFHVQASDYLDRTHLKSSLKAKLSAYLQSQGVQNAVWNHAFLITAPRFLGYSFNPVSFWYIYTADSKLSMMILEVNNTFDEKRMYLLKSDEPEEEATESLADNEGNLRDKTPGRFKHEWAKDFHVSPFSSRKGNYSLSAIDPFGKNSSFPIVFDNTIVLKSSKDHAKLVARVFSDGVAINPHMATQIEVARVLLSWCWVGFLTAPRILKEAFVLYFKRGLHVWLRPEVLPSSIGRRATQLEISLEPFFTRYLAYLVEHSNANLVLIYKSGLDISSQQVFQSHINEGATETLEIRVSSPAFFCRVMHYAHTAEAFDRESIFTDEKNRTVSISRPGLLLRLLSANKNIKSHRQPGVMERMRWSLHRQLRCPPSSPKYPLPVAEKAIVDIRTFPPSPLDCHVQSSNIDIELYFRQCTRVFLAQRFALGFIEIFDTLDLLARFGLTVLAISTVTGAAQSASVHGTLRVISASLQMLSINGLNIYSLVKQV
ncbi:hypothetical protein EJ08DRAFT_589348 [Tothia fuscella]|uniref:Uncharacterized protein n=1 Tax=Tothia fuscella TaxID=1048955 RepID=A0A9P4TYD8_9PEZI|nr:hypothetical protein EJ08DRAFT_589348 [Tothia fuscella]